MATTETHVLGVKAAQIAPLTADVAPAPTYGTAIAAPGIKEVKLTVKTSTKELRGNNGPLVKETIVETVEIEFTVAKWSGEFYAALTGADLTVTGDAFAVSFGSSTTPGYFSFEAISAGAEGTDGNAYLFLPKCKITEPPALGFAEEDFQTYTIKAEAIPSTATGEWFMQGYDPDGYAL